jgi:phospholipid/cholesterol/gamma-HCH transport system permease protein
MAEQATREPRGLVALAAAAGAKLLALFELTGEVWYLLAEMVRWLWRAATGRSRLGRPAIVSQIVRVGVRSILIISLVSGCVGLILVLQMAPPLDDFGSKDLVANITAVAVLRELGPLIAAIVLTGFAGAAIAAEIGTMVVGEEIEALEAHALNPIRFLVVPRVLATVISMGCLAVIADLVAVFAGMFTSSIALGIPTAQYMSNTLDQVESVDFLTGVGKGLVFGLLIGSIACTNGLRVTGGAAGVGQATTGTVVQSVVAIIVADLIFTSIFYSLGLV